MIIKSLIETLWRVFHPTPPPITRLSSDDALRLARERAAQEGHDTAELTWVQLQEVDGRLVWFVSPPAIGSILVVEIDDARGEVTSIERLPGR